ncbi:hypothetical protein CAPTEDRAFT_221882 [Capitella teleta]|uniref:MalT-like TPR region domain-containing protein n=1 Tax=Capitella teleta TaxID=283909 RepID=R7T3F5_CAPTE|nr:hypothetical protein CAPTEDRAFT_221882 [Capitella teleta]|eukprot:ELT87183.1 hypothetical protein CAPTEDRAFT_221882 [Capitella teleta]
MGAASTDVNHYTEQGSQALCSNDLRSALKSFSKAYENSLPGKDESTIRACAFNLGAAYIALRKPKEGLSLLQRAIPPPKAPDCRCNGDLFFNFGLAYELMPAPREAVKYFELSLEEYQTSSRDLKMEAFVSLKLGSIYNSIKCHLQAARVYSIAAVAHGKMEQTAQQIACMCHQANSLWQAGKEQDGLDIADDCMVLCQGVPNDNNSLSKPSSLNLFITDFIAYSLVVGKVYIELGLLYSQCRDYSKASTCFELALPLSRGPHGNKGQQAVIEQNLGAVYNFLGDFKQAVNYHETASHLHAELGNRGFQAQCFINLAYAYSQLKQSEMAMECYLHALQAARDANDSHTQWQALEGLGAASFNMGFINKAIKYFKMSLATLAQLDERNLEAQERLVNKLSDALRYELSKGGVDVAQLKNIKRESDDSEDEELPNILVNGIERPPTRQEMRMMVELKELRLQRDTRKIPSEFKRIALGIGEYDGESDRSVERKRRSLKTKASKDFIDSRKAPPGPHGRITRRQSSRRLITQEYQRRRGNKPLLFAGDYDSDQDRKRKHQTLSVKDRALEVAKLAYQYYPLIRQKFLKDEDPYLFGTSYAETDDDPPKRPLSPKKEAEVNHGPPSPSDHSDQEADRKPVKKDGKLSRYEEELKRLQEEDSDESQTPGPSALDTLTSMPTHSPRPPPSHRPLSAHKAPLTSTYEKPVKSKIKRRTSNYFREEEEDSDGEKSNISKEKMTIPTSEDPLYASIKSVTNGIARTKELEGVPPTPPPRRKESELEAKSKEKDEYLQEYHKKWEENMRANIGRPETDDSHLLPQKGKRRNQSTACTIM